MADTHGFDEFYLASRDRVALQVAAFTGDPAEALDHVQEAFVRAWTRWDRIKTYDDPEGWVRQVSERERQVIVLHHLVGYTVEEIAAELRAPSGTVKSWLSRGRARLADLLRTDEELADDPR